MDVLAAPQRRPEGPERALAALEDGTLDLVSSDHAPFRYDESGQASPPGPRGGGGGGGAPLRFRDRQRHAGLETRLPLLFDAHGHERPDGPRSLRATHRRTYRRHSNGLDAKGAIAPGKDADLVIWDAERIGHLNGADEISHDNVGYNPFPEGRGR